MNSKEAWKNFNLGEELGISGVFIYNGMRRFYELRNLDYTDGIFEVLYNLSVGLERLLKVAVVFVEHDDNVDQEQLERDLITHNHLELVNRIKKRTEFNLGKNHNELLALLGRFYKSYRYGRFSIDSVYNPDQEKLALRDMLGKHLDVDLTPTDSFFATENDDRYRRHLNKLVRTISRELFELVSEKAAELNVYTYELRSGSKADTIFRGQTNNDFFLLEEVTWKELLVFFMNTQADHPAIRFLRGIEPLDIDPWLVGDYLESFRSNAATAAIIGEIEAAYDSLDDPGDRLKILKLIANPSAQWDDARENGEEG